MTISASTAPSLVRADTGPAALSLSIVALAGRAGADHRRRVVRFGPAAPATGHPRGPWQTDLRDDDEHGRQPPGRRGPGAARTRPRRRPRRERRRAAADRR
ncbi:hypothetical protein CWI85_16395, partial [Streptomyces albidoflavus]